MAPKEIGSCSGYLELMPHKTITLLDLVRILCSSDNSLANQEFIDVSEPHHLQGLEIRWIIFLSLFAQKILLYLKKPMVWTRDAIEMWLNRLSSNGGFVKLFLNILTGSVVTPDKKSGEFVSVLGYTDTRVELDKNIKSSTDYNRYGAALSIMASKLAYEYPAFAKNVIAKHWKMEVLGCFNFWNEYQNQLSTQAIMFKDTTSSPNLIVVAFRGTEPFDADQWRTDVDFSWYDIEGVEYQNQLSTQAIMFKDTTSSPNLIVVAFRGTEPFDADQWRTDVDFSWYDIEGVGKIHSGFLKALGLHKKTGWPKDIIEDGSGREYAYYTIKEKLKKELEKDKDVKFIVTGHSLGAALAILFVAGLVLHEEEELLESLDWVYTYGQPRVGNEQFADWMGEKMRIHDVKYLRYVYCNDLVPRVPYDDQTNSLYKHFGPCLWVNSFYKGKVVWEEPDKNYFSLLWVIPKILNAVWELIRSFIIPYIYGPDYKESWFMTLVRVFGLLIPGLAAHCPQDYDNATRLGSFPPEILIQQVLNGKHD